MSNARGIEKKGSKLRKRNFGTETGRGGRIKDRVRK